MTQYTLSWWMFHILEKNVYLQLSCVMFYKYQLDCCKVRFPSQEADFAMVICKQEVYWRVLPWLTTVGKYTKQKWAEREVELQSSFNRGLTWACWKHGTGESLQSSSFSSYSVSLYSFYWAVKLIKLQCSAVVLAVLCHVDWGMLSRTSHVNVDLT